MSVADMVEGGRSDSRKVLISAKWLQRLPSKQRQVQEENTMPLLNSPSDGEVEEATELSVFVVVVVLLSCCCCFGDFVGGGDRDNGLN